MSHPLGAPGGGRERPLDPTYGATSTLTDEDLTLRLVEDIQAGINVEESSRKLFLLHRRKVIGFFLRRGFSSEDSTDLTQDVFFRVFNAIAAFRRESRFEKWLFEIALNVYRNELRRRGAEKRGVPEVSLDRSLDDESTSGSKEPASEEKSALDSMTEQEQRAKLLAALRELPTQMRACCEMRYVQGLKYHEIATAMNISIETVKAHLHQARKRLMEKLGGKK